MATQFKSEVFVHSANEHLTAKNEAIRMQRSEIILILCISQFLSFENLEYSSIVQSITSLSLQSNKNHDIFIVKSINNDSNAFCNELINDIAMNLRSNFKVLVEDSENLKELKKMKRNFIIIIVDSVANFVKLHKKMNNKMFQLSGFYVVLAINEYSRISVVHTFALLWKSLIFNVAFIHYDSDNIVLLTFMPFSKERCNSVKPVKINDFNENTKQWESEDFFPPKFRNLQSCAIKVGTYETAPGLMINSNENRLKLYGFEGDLFNDIAKHLNFTMNITVVNYSGGAVYENGSATGLIEKIINNEFDLIMSLFSANFLRSVFLTPTLSYFIDKMIVIIPADRMLDSFLKLFYAFQFTLWMILVSIFASVILILNLVKYCFPQFNQTALKEIRTPFLSFLITFVGGSEKNLPRKHFPRMLLATFLIFCLVVRSIYQGALFNIMKRDILVNQIKSINDINELKFTFFVMQSIEVKIKDQNMFHRQV